VDAAKDEATQRSWKAPNWKSNNRDTMPRGVLGMNAAMMEDEAAHENAAQRHRQLSLSHGSGDHINNVPDN
jgi:hypothetical protein